MQLKQATDSALMVPLGLKAHAHNGQRIVHGLRLCQANSDIFSGWVNSKVLGAKFYVRQLRDMKASLDLALFSAFDMTDYAQACGYALVAGFIGKSKTFDEAHCPARFYLC